jgi:predicted transcriptional regulator
MKKKSNVTELQDQALKAIGRRKMMKASMVAEAMGMPGQAIRVSGVLSSLVEVGLLETERVPGERGVFYRKPLGPVDLL